MATGSDRAEEPVTRAPICSTAKCRAGFRHRLLVQSAAGCHDTNSLESSRLSSFSAAASATAGSAEAQTAAEPGYRAPRAPDGQPDISGIWTNDTLTPLERPPELGDKAFYSAEEAEAIERRGTGARDRDNAPGRQRTSAGGSLDRGYNFFWFDPRDHIVPTRRTSMVAEPPNGRVPTRPAAEARAAWLVANRSASYLNMSPYSRCITRGVPGRCSRTRTTPATTSSRSPAT